MLLSYQVCKRNIESSLGAGAVGTERSLQVWELVVAGGGGRGGGMEGSGIMNLSRIQTRG